MKYLLLVHFPLENLTSLPREAQDDVDRRSVAYDEELKARGHLIEAQALEPPETAVLVKVRNGKMSTTDGPFTETKEQLAGFILVDARDLNEAIGFAAGIPLAEMGTIEVRAIYDFRARLH